ncbi:hypothetical protein [Brucella intermedia]|uniref:hypothetical protein n=1 Tax=Brucella intermedia TaxID=94625 RepID=UPI00124D9E45|nr:hypothetical protein [Brucella intermedia]KAB2690368.1 hypothetical protein F9K72_21490 [Brucella intermedia]
MRLTYTAKNSPDSKYFSTVTISDIKRDDGGAVFVKEYLSIGFLSPTEITSNNDIEFKKWGLVYTPTITKCEKLAHDEYWVEIAISETNKTPFHIDHGEDIVIRLHSDYGTPDLTKDFARYFRDLIISVDSPPVSAPVAAHSEISVNKDSYASGNDIVITVTLKDVHGHLVSDQTTMLKTAVKADHAQPKGEWTEVSSGSYQAIFIAHQTGPALTAVLTLGNANLSSKAYAIYAKPAVYELQAPASLHPGEELHVKYRFEDNGTGNDVSTFQWMYRKGISGAWAVPLDEKAKHRQWMPDNRYVGCQVRLVVTPKGSLHPELVGDPVESNSVEIFGKPAVHDLQAPASGHPGEELQVNYWFEENGAGNDVSAFQWMYRKGTSGAWTAPQDENAKHRRWTPDNSYVGYQVRLVVTPKGNLHPELVGDPVESNSVEITQRLARLPAGISVNGHTFNGSDGFPTTGYKGAKFTILPPERGASSYSWESSATWASVDQSGVVTFVDTGNGDSVTITATPKWPADSVKYTFRLTSWFSFVGHYYWRELKPYINNLPTVRELTNASIGPLAPGGNVRYEVNDMKRAVGPFCSEWGRFSSVRIDGKDDGRTEAWTTDSGEGHVNNYVNLSTGAVVGYVSTDNLVIKRTRL